MIRPQSSRFQSVPNFRPLAPSETMQQGVAVAPLADAQGRFAVVVGRAKKRQCHYAATGTSTEPLRTNAIATTATGGNGVFWCLDPAPATNTKRFPVSNKLGAGNFLIVLGYAFLRFCTNPFALDSIRLVCYASSAFPQYIIAQHPGRKTLNQVRTPLSATRNFLGDKGIQ